MDEKYAKEIKETCHSGDPDRDHRNADRILLEILDNLGFDEVVSEFENVNKWYA